MMYFMYIYLYFKACDIFSVTIIPVVQLNSFTKVYLKKNPSSSNVLEMCVCVCLCLENIHFLCFNILICI